MKEKIIILDTSAFIAGFDPLVVTEKQYSVPEVKSELKEGSLPWIRFNTAVEKNKVKIIEPKDFFFQEILTNSKKVGDIGYLSKVDLKVLALALELKNKGLNPLIITDDYSIQNVSNKVGINFTSLLTFGIKLRFNWIQYCPACFRNYPTDFKPKLCKVCGTLLKRKPKKKSLL